MKDMFYNYENNIDKKEYPRPINFPENTRVLESTQNCVLVTDIKGNEIGVQVKHNEAFTLYFNLEGCVEGSSISELVMNSAITFQILDIRHVVVYSKDINPADAFKFDAIRVDVNRDAASKLKIDSYKMRLALSWPGGGYELFSENNGLLIVR